ncbi:hypothetical protein CKO09_03055 [Chromatium weissei]|nr:hypothetical protein [Chromatium weissei]
MADTETATKSKTKAKPRSTFGWFPKLILWGVVITFGYLYLSSLDQQDGELSATLLAKINEISPIPISALPGMGEKSPATETPAAAPAPVERKAAPETFTHKTAEPAKPVAAPAPASVDHSSKFTESTASTSTPVSETAAPVQPQPAAPVSVASQPQASVAMTPPPSSTATSAPSVAAPQPVAPSSTNQMPPASAMPSYNWEAMAQHQAMMQARYAEMQREANARMREYWERMQSAPAPAPAPAMVPYGYPNYPAGYLPGAPNSQR